MIFTEMYQAARRGDRDGGVRLRRAHEESKSATGWRLISGVLCSNPDVILTHVLARRVDRGIERRPACGGRTREVSFKDKALDLKNFTWG